MKALMFVFVTLLTFQSWSQYEGTSFYFSIENLNQESFLGFEDDEIGFYSINKDYRRHLVVDKDSIAVRSGFEIVISKSVAISKGFTFEDGKMYGMEPYNGVHYEEVNDTIVALYYQFDHYYNSSDIILKGKKGYFLLTAESNNLYSCEFIEFTLDGISISSIDHPDVMKSILKITEIKEDNINKMDTYIASPSLKELEQLVKKDCFNDLRSYSKVKHL